MNIQLHKIMSKQYTSQHTTVSWTSAPTTRRFLRLHWQLLPGSKPHSIMNFNARHTWLPWLQKLVCRDQNQDQNLIVPSTSTPATRRFLRLLQKGGLPWSKPESELGSKPHSAINLNAHHTRFLKMQKVVCRDQNWNQNQDQNLTVPSTSTPTTRRFLRLLQKRCLPGSKTSQCHQPQRLLHAASQAARGSLLGSKPHSAINFQAHHMQLLRLHGRRRFTWWHEIRGIRSSRVSRSRGLQNRTPGIVWWWASREYNSGCRCGGCVLFPCWRWISGAACVCVFVCVCVLLCVCVMHTQEQNIHMYTYIHASTPTIPAWGDKGGKPRINGRPKVTSEPGAGDVLPEFMDEPGTGDMARAGDGLRVARGLGEGDWAFSFARFMISRCWSRLTRQFWQRAAVGFVYPWHLYACMYVYYARFMISCCSSRLTRQFWQRAAVGFVYPWHLQVCMYIPMYAYLWFL
jgi:hypothetical protein